ncbi:MAG: helix-turn-helix domain-containing protein [Chloroflexi bacterium]|nr:helix-turn-helix domain-containing protein [Chloroflexota bacterium]
MANTLASDRRHEPTSTARQYVTVAEAARLLQVSPSTIWRWIQADKLPAYRVGEKTIRVRKADLDAIIRPANVPAKGVTTMKESKAATPSTTSIAAGIRPVTVAEVTRGLAALERARALATAMQARRGGKRLPDSVELIREERAERASRL